MAYVREMSTQPMLLVEYGLLEYTSCWSMAFLSFHKQSLIITQHLFNIPSNDKNNAAEDLFIGELFASLDGTCKQGQQLLQWSHIVVHGTVVYVQYTVVQAVSPG